MTLLDIGLVNNMPDPALEATERQFVTLLNEAAGEDITVRLERFALPGVPRTDPGRHHLSSYSGIDSLWGRSLDGLIVTGTEPRAPHLEDEPYWEHLTRLLGWAAQNTTAAIWSCLAAHAAVLHLDGIRRCRLSQKRFGVFECLHVGEHFLTAGAPARVRIPHSRWNDLREHELKAAGYEILRRFEDGGVDTFVKQRESLFVFFQGHPEYEVGTLLREYRRDVKRFLRRESEVYPQMPHGHSDPSGVVTNTWRSDAVRFYRNWLSYMAERKGRRLQLLCSSR
jgi:homoserine O-succinyltransferase